MSNTSYLTAKRNGTRAGVAKGAVRICVTLREEAFNALRDRAAGRGHTLSGEAALLIGDRLAKKDAQADAYNAEVAARESAS